MNGKFVVARKRHQCNGLCGAPIEQGERYWSERIGPIDHSDNDSFWTWKAHEFCKRLFDVHRDELDFELPDPGTWAELVAEWLALTTYGPDIDGTPFPASPRAVNRFLISETFGGRG